MTNSHSRSRDSPQASRTRLRFFVKQDMQNEKEQESERFKQRFEGTLAQLSTIGKLVRMSKSVHQ